MFSHIMSEAGAVAGRVAIVGEGHLITAGTLAGVIGPSRRPGREAKARAWPGG